MKDANEQFLREEEHRQMMDEIYQERKEQTAEVLVKGYGEGDFAEWLIDVFAHTEDFTKFYNFIMDDDDLMSGEVIREAWEKAKWEMALKDSDDYL